MVKMSDIGLVINRAKDVLKKLKENHSGPRTYLVFSSRFGQGGMKSGIDLFSEFPEMFLSEELVGNIKSKIKEKELIEKQLKTKSEEVGKKMRELNGKFTHSDEKELNGLKESIKSVENEINDLLPNLSVKDEVFVELRFEQLNFEYIQNLKEDPLVSQEYTIREGRSIKVVLFRVNDIDV
jgi:hypothetical protein